MPSSNSRGTDADHRDVEQRRARSALARLRGLGVVALLLAYALQKARTHLDLPVWLAIVIFVGGLLSVLWLLQWGAYRRASAARQRPP